MVKFAYLNDAFFEAFYLQASPLEGQSVQQIMKRKVEKGKAKQIIKEKKQKPNLERRRSLSRLKILISTHARAKMS